MWRSSTAFFLVFSVIIGQLATPLEITIMHTNDVHARFEQFDKDGGKCSVEEAESNQCYGGVARRVTKVAEIRAKHRNTLLLDGGDQFQGTQWFYHYEGDATAHFMNLLGYDAMVRSSLTLYMTMDVVT